LSLVSLPPDSLMFPNPPSSAAFSFTKLREPRGLTKEFVLKAKALGFQGLRFHDLRGSYETALLDAGVPVHVVAARCGRPGRAVAQLCQTHQESRHQRGSGAISKGALR